MLKFFIKILLLTACLTISESNADDKYILTATYNKSFFSEETVDMFGLNLEIFVSKNISLNYSLAFGSGNNGWNIHAPAGIIGGINLFDLGIELDEYNDDNESSSGFFYGSAILSAILPEGINFHFPLSSYISVCPYINPLGYNYYRYGESFSSSAGLKLVYSINERFVIIPNVGFTLLYRLDRPIAPNIGVAVGFR